MPVDVPKSSTSVRTTDWLAESESVTGLVTPVPETAWPDECRALIVRFAVLSDRLNKVFCVWCVVLVPVQYRVFVTVRETPSCTAISCSAYRGTAVDGRNAWGMAAAIGASVTSMVGCAIATTPPGTIATVYGMSKD